MRSRVISRWRLAPLFLLLCLWALGPGADIRPCGAEEAGQDASQRAQLRRFVAAVRRAVRESDPAALTGLAEHGIHDHWAVADELLAAGDETAAQAWAKLTSDFWGGTALRAYVRRRPSNPDSARELLARAERAHSGDDADARSAVRAQLATFLQGDRDPSILSIRLALVAAALDADRAQWESCAAVADRARAWAKGVGWPEAWIQGANFLREARFETGRLLAALEVIRAQEAFNIQRGDRIAAAFTKSDEANLLASLGDHKGAAETYAEALKRVRALKLEDGGVGQAFVRVGLALSLAMRGRYADALSHAEWAASAARRAGDVEVLVYALGAELSTLSDIGDAASALTKARQILDIPNLPPPVVADTRMNAALAAASLGDSELAKEELAEVLAIYKEAPDPHWSALALLNRGFFVHAAQGAHDEAIADYRRALTMMGDDPMLKTYAHRRLGESLLAKKQRGEAIRHLELSLELAHKLTDRDRELQAFVGLGHGHLEGNALPAAREAFDSAYALLSHVSGGLSDERAAAARGMSSRLRLHTGAIELGVRLAKREPSLLVEYLERGRAAALLEAMGGREQLQSVALTDDLADAHAQAHTELAAAKQRVNYVSRLRGRHKKEHAALRTAERGLQQIRERMRREAKRLSDLAIPEPASMADLQQALGPRQALVYYVLRAGRSLALVLDAQGAKMVFLPGATKIRALCEDLYVRDPHEPEAGILKARRALTGALVDPIPLSGGVRQVLLSPDGELAHLAWPLLWRDRTKLEVALVPSGTTWQMLRENGRRHGKGLVAAGDPRYTQTLSGIEVRVLGRYSPLEPLRFTRKELAAIQEPGDVTLLDDDATKEKLLAAIRKPGRREAIHLACHGLLHPDRAGLSALALTPTKDDDGFLRSIEVIGLQVDTDLVVLSACDVGRGKIARGEGLMGLTRAFMVAGAPRVLASLQRVDDESTAALMKAFYAAWREGAGTAAALRAAQRHVASKPKWKHPYYWANWVLWGLPD